MTSPLTRLALAATVSLFATGLATAHASPGAGPVGPSRYAQLDSPGDGLDQDAGAQGNGRPAGKGKKSKNKKRM